MRGGYGETCQVHLVHLDGDEGAHNLSLGFTWWVSTFNFKKSKIFVLVQRLGVAEAVAPYCRTVEL